MPSSFLLSRIQLQFNSSSENLIGQLSAVAKTPDGSLWLGSDEFLTVERLSLVAPFSFANHKSYCVGDYIELFDEKVEIDIEGMDYDGHYLWLTGSHSAKRQKAKGKKAAEDIKRLSTIKTELNRYLFVRIPIVDGKLANSCADPDHKKNRLTAACLKKTQSSNVLIDILQKDEHLGPFLNYPIPSKENGFDIEGLAILGNRVFIGFRGPVLRGWAIILEIEIVEEEPGVLNLKEIDGKSRAYKKHFLSLDGLGIRDLSLHENEMIVLAGPTMTLDGALRVYRLKSILDHSHSGIHEVGDGDLRVSFDLPIKSSSDRAEGIVVFPCLDHENSLLIVYDSPNQARRPNSKTVYGDVFQLL